MLASTSLHMVLDTRPCADAAAAVEAPAPPPTLFYRPRVYLVSVLLELDEAGLVFEVPVPVPRLSVPTDAATPHLVAAATLAAAKRNKVAAAAQALEDHAWDQPQRRYMAAIVQLARTAGFVRVSQGRYLDVVSFARRLAVELPPSWDVLLVDAKPQWAMFVRLVGMHAYFLTHTHPPPFNGMPLSAARGMGRGSRGGSGGRC
jgi:hypothetical protein